MTSGKGEAPFASAARSRRARAWLRALRPHQWAKNLLVFVPVLLAGPLGGRADLARAALGFAVLSLLSAAGYVVNDLLDVEADRRHRAKRLRPFAAGELAVAEGVPGAALLALAAAGLAALMPPPFVPVAAVYLAGTLAYSLALKREPLLDVLALAGLFTVRVLAGAALLPLPLSFWLLTFSMFLFLSLALVKRYAELAELARTGAAAPSRAAATASRSCPSCSPRASPRASRRPPSSSSTWSRSGSPPASTPGRAGSGSSSRSSRTGSCASGGSPSTASWARTRCCSRSRTVLAGAGCRGAGPRAARPMIRASDRHLAWGRAHRHRHAVARPAGPAEAMAALRAAGRPALAYGRGRSYGDVLPEPGRPPARLPAGSTALSLSTRRPAC